MPNTDIIWKLLVLYEKKQRYCFLRVAPYAKHFYIITLSILKFHVLREKK